MKKKENIFKRIKNRCQRGKEGFSDKDASNIINWFVDIMPKILKRARELNNNYPVDIYMNYYDEHKDSINISRDEFFNLFKTADRTNQLYVEADKWAKEEWKNILDTMIFLFEESNDSLIALRNRFEKRWRKTVADYKRKYRKEIKEMDKEDISEEYSIFNLDEYKETAQWYAEEKKFLIEYQLGCRKEAINLFSKYFDCLLW